MEYRPKNLYRILDWYQEHGYIEVPGYYSGDNHCRLCGWENRNGHGAICLDCEGRYKRDKKDGKFPMGLKYVSIEDWLILQAIAHQMKHNEHPYATLEEFLENIKKRMEHHRQWTVEQQTKDIQYRENSILYSSR